MMVRQISLLIMGENSLASALFVAMFFISFVSFILYILEVGRFSLLCISACFLCLVVCFLLQDLFLTHIKETLPFLLTILLLSVLPGLSKAFYKARNLYRMYIIVAVLLLIVELLFPRNYVQGELLYYTNNANQSGVLLLCYFINVYMFFLEKGRSNFFLKLFYVFLLLGLAVAAYMTGSRTVLLSMLILVAFLFLFCTTQRKLKIALYIVFLGAIVLPYVFAKILPMFGDNVLFLGDVIETGREIVWENATQRIWKSLFEIHIGQSVPTIGLQYYGEGLGAHNTFLEIAWRYSGAVFILFTLFFYKVFRQVINKASDKALKVILPTLIAVLFHATFESVFFVGAFDYTLLILIPIMMSLGKQFSRETI